MERKVHMYEEVKKKLPEWYDQSLTFARKNLNDKFNLLNKYPKDPYVRSFSVFESISGNYERINTGNINKTF